MTRKQRLWNVVRAGLCLGALCSVRLASAQIATDQQGSPACILKARPVPGLSGLPVWPALEGRALNTVNPGTPGWVPPSDTAAERGDVSDPRWANAPLTGMHYSYSPDGLNLSQQNVRFRIAVDPADRSKLAVQVQVTVDDNGPSLQDWIVFGFASWDGSNAWGVKINPVKGGSASPSSYVKLPNTSLRDFIYTGGAWTPPQGTQAAMPSWIDRDATNAAGSELISFWNSSTPDELDKNGARWTIEFRVKLPSGVTGASGGPDADRARFFVGAHIDQTPGGIDYATGNIFTACGAGVNCAVTPSTPKLAAFPITPAQWTPLASLNGACTGVGVRGEEIKSTGSTNAWTVNVDPSDVNTFDVKADGALINQSVAADLFIANWGSVSSTSAGWNKLPNELVASNAPTLNDATGMFRFKCTNTGTAGLNICNKVQQANIRSADHQCLQVQLRQASTSTPVVFSNASDYTNMFYEHLSESAQIAEISVKGLQQALGNNRTRDVYLHVVTHNLPLPGSAPQSLNVQALDALRAQVDRSFPQPNLTCDQSPADRCLPGPNGTGVCRRPALFAEPEGEFGGYWYCNSEVDPILIDGRYYCPLSTSESCVVPAGGGFDPTKSSLTQGQVLRAEFPTIEIFPYYDSGTTYTVSGVTKKHLVPMPSFGMYFTHTGNFYGFLRSLVEEYNTLSGKNERVLTQVGPDTYKLSVANESVATLRVSVATQDTPPSTLFQIVGTATPLGFTLGNATITGIARSRTLDLSRSSVVVSKLLYSNGKELVTNLRAPVTLARNAGALPGLATFTKTGSPTINMQVVTLPLIGQTITMQVTNASVDVPQSCPLLIGSATLQSSFTISDGLGSPAQIDGSDTWACFPGQLVSF